MKCTNCGTDIAENATFCPACGNSVQQQWNGQQGYYNQNQVQQPYGQYDYNQNGYAQNGYQQNGYPQNGYQQGAYDQNSMQGYPLYNQPEQKKKAPVGLIAGICAAVAVVVVVVVLLLTGVLGGGYKKPIKVFMEGAKKASSEKMFDAFQDEVVDTFFDNMYFSKDEFFDMLDEELEDEDMSDLKYSIEDAKKLDKDDCEEYEEYLDDYFDIDAKVTAGYKVKVKMKHDGETETEKFNVFKVDGKWYISAEFMSDMY